MEWPIAQWAIGISQSSLFLVLQVSCRVTDESYVPMQAYKLIFTSLSSIDIEEPKAMCSCNACIHGMYLVTKALIAYVVTQVGFSFDWIFAFGSSPFSHTHFAFTSAQVFSHSDLSTDSECFYNSVLKHFYNSILKFLDDPEEKDEVELLLGWWNR